MAPRMSQTSVGLSAHDSGGASSYARPMRARFSGGLLVGGGVATWVAVGLPVVVSGGGSPAWWTAYVAFALAFGLAVATPVRLPALIAQSLAALVAIALGGNGFGGALLCVVAGEAPLVAGELAGIACVIAQTVALVALDVGGATRGGHFATAAYVGFQLFAFGAGRLAVRERAARTELARVHAELVATQALFADSVRTAERVRIARELHDALGHHLTALSIQLELARNVADGRAVEPIERAHGLAKDLLGELRVVVSTMRDDPPLDLVRAIETLASGISRPRVQLELAADLRLDPASAHALFRCAQEALTNAVRHAGAETVHVTLAERDGAIELEVRDDGRGGAEVTAGHGLTGLRERALALGGSVAITTRDGFALRVRLPARPA